MDRDTELDGVMPEAATLSPEARQTCDLLFVSLGEAMQANLEYGGITAIDDREDESHRNIPSAERFAEQWDLLEEGRKYGRYIDAIHFPFFKGSQEYDFVRESFSMKIAWESGEILVNLSDHPKPAFKGVMGAEYRVKKEGKVVETQKDRQSVMHQFEDLQRRLYTDLPVIH